MAPEILSKEAPYTYKSDNWSLGVMLYIMIFAEPPFKGRSNSKIFAEIRNHELNFSSEQYKKINPEIISLIKKLLVKDPTKRIELSEALRCSWFHSHIVEIHENWSLKQLKCLLIKFKETKIKSRFKKEVVKIMTKIFYDS